MQKTLYGYLSVSRQRAICVVTDWMTTFIAFFCFNIFRYHYMHLVSAFPTLFDYLTTPKMILEQLIVPPLLLIVYWLSGYYNKPFERSRLNEFLITLYSQIFNSLILYLGALTNDQLYLRRENWLLLLILFLLLFAFVYIGRLMVTENMLKRIKINDYRPRTVIIGTSPDAAKIASKLKDPESKIKARLLGFLPFGSEKPSPEVTKNFPEVPYLESIEDLKKLCANKEIDQVIIVPSPGKSSSKKILYLLYNLYPYEISIKINPDTISIITPTIRLDDILGEPFVDLTSPGISEFTRNMKRSIDVIFSLAGLIVFSPLLLSMALAVRLSGKGPVIYKQERIGVHRKPFNILKFRSMVNDAEQDGVPRLSSDSDERITPIGKLMRKYRLDELPQFWNVLRGDMSLVGPRPEREYFIDRIVKKAPWYTLALQVRPGITSWGMVKYGYATDIDQMIERNRFDLIYLSNMSIAVDFKILIHTLKTVGSGEGK